MSIEKIDELLKIQKKTTASKEKKLEFFNEILKFYNQVGYSDKLEKYIIDGFGFTGSAPIIEFMKSKNSDEKRNIIDRILKGKIYKKNEKGVGFKLVVSLLCQMINHFPNEKSIIEVLIKEIIKKSQNKEGKILGIATQVLERYFILDLDENAELPELKKLALEPILILEFVNMLSEIIRKIKIQKNTSKIKIDKLKAWIVKNNKESNEQIENTEDVEKKTLNNKTKIIKEKVFDFNSLNSSEFNEFIEDFTEDILIIKNILIYAQKLEDEIKLLSKQIKIKGNEIDFLNKEKDKLLDLSAKEKKDKLDLLDKYSKINDELIIYKQKFIDSENKIKIKDEEILKQKNVLSVFLHDKENALNEQLNSIASKLKPEYLDYKDAINMEMNDELGENFRHQLSVIFKILSKNGIDIERR